MQEFLGAVEENQEQVGDISGVENSESSHKSFIPEMDQEEFENFDLGRIIDPRFNIDKTKLQKFRQLKKILREARNILVGDGVDP